MVVLDNLLDILEVKFNDAGWKLNLEFAGKKTEAVLISALKRNMQMKLCIADHSIVFHSISSLHTIPMEDRDSATWRNTCYSSSRAGYKVTLIDSANLFEFVKIF